MGQNGSVAQPVEKETESQHKNPFFSTHVKKFHNYSSNNSSINKQNFDSNVFSTNPFSPTNQNSQGNMIREKDNTHTHNPNSNNSSKYNNYLRLFFK